MSIFRPKQYYAQPIQDLHCRPYQLVELAISNVDDVVELLVELGAAFDMPKREAITRKDASLLVDWIAQAAAHLEKARAALSSLDELGPDHAPYVTMLRDLVDEIDVMVRARSTEVRTSRPSG